MRFMGPSLTELKTTWPLESDSTLYVVVSLPNGLKNCHCEPNSDSFAGSCGSAGANETRGPSVGFGLNRPSGKSSTYPNDTLSSLRSYFDALRMMMCREPSGF